MRRIVGTGSPHVKTCFALSFVVAYQGTHQFVPSGHCLKVPFGPAQQGGDSVGRRRRADGVSALGVPISGSRDVHKRAVVRPARAVQEPHVRDHAFDHLQETLAFPRPPTQDLNSYKRSPHRASDHRRAGDRAPPRSASRCPSSRPQRRRSARCAHTRASQPLTCGSRNSAARRTSVRSPSPPGVRVQVPPRQGAGPAAGRPTAPAVVARRGATARPRGPGRRHSEATSNPEFR
jgi:hypothetical protein